MYSEVVKLGHKTALHIQSLLLLPSEVRPRPVVKDEAGAPLGPTLPPFLKTLSAAWWPESLGVRDMLCVKSVLFEVCLGLEIEQAGEAQELRDCQTVSQRPKQTVSSVGKEASRANKAFGPVECRVASMWTDCNPLWWGGRDLQVPS